MDLSSEQLGKLKIPQQQEERNKVLLDALKTQNPLLIEFALAIGAEPQKGGDEMLEYAIKQGNLAVVKKLLLNSEQDEKTTAMNMAIDNNQIEIGTWLSKEGIWMIINQERIRKHYQTIMRILSNNPEAKAEIKYGALLHAAIVLQDGHQTLEILFKTMKKHTPGALSAWLEKLADDTVDTDRVECMEVMVKYGLNVRYVNTKYCEYENMRKFLKENGARIN